MLSLYLLLMWTCLKIETNIAISACIVNQEFEPTPKREYNPHVSFRDKSKIMPEAINEN
jgi:hypothetical protein